MSKKKKKFKRPDDPWWNPDDEQDYDQAYGGEEDSSPPLPSLNESYIDAFVAEWQPEEDERVEGARSFSLGELRDVMQIYRTFDDKSPDPLTYYLNRLHAYGFRTHIGFAGELVMTVRRRHREGDGSIPI